MSYFYIFMTIMLTVYGQIAIKWQAVKAGPLPEVWPEKINYLFQLLLNPWVISAFAAALLASVFWMAAIAKLQLSHAYPFMSAAFALILVASSLIFHEPITPLKVVGVTLIFIGIFVGSQG